MTRKIAIGLVLCMFIIAAWGVFFENNIITVIIDGQEVSGPLRGAIGVGGMLVAFIASLCAAMLLLFVFAGIWVFMLGVLIVACVTFAAGVSPLFLTVLVPVAVVWAFLAIVLHKT